MGLPFLSGDARKLDQIVSIDVGTSTTKAVHVQKKAGSTTLSKYTILDVPKSDKGLNSAALGQHFQQVVQALGARCKDVVLTLGVTDSVMRVAEMPILNVGDMRAMLKVNSKNYLQQELPDHVFDCAILPSPMTADGKIEVTKPGQKGRVLVGAAKHKVVDDYQAAARSAGLFPCMVVPNLACAPNVLEAAMPDSYRKEVIALVDLGFKSSTITLMVEGVPQISRVVSIGGDRVTAGLAEAMEIGYGEAEGIKVGMPSEVQTHLEPLLSPLARELRASIDFFEHQQDKTVSQVLMSGGPARSEFIVQALQSDLMVPCKAWNPAATMTLGLPPQQMAEIEQVAPQLTVAVGAALAVF